MPSISLLGGYRAWVKPPNWALPEEAAEETLRLQGRERERSAHAGAGNFPWDLPSSENVGRCWISSTATHSVLVSESQLLSVTTLEGQRGALWLLKPQMLFAFQESTRTLSGNSQYTTASRRYCQWTAWSYFGLTQCTAFAIYPWVSFPSTVFIFTHTTIAPSVTMSIILNAMAIVMVSKMQELPPVSGSVQGWQQRTRELLILGLLSPGKGTEGRRWSSRRQVTNASP